MERSFEEWGSVYDGLYPTFQSLVDKLETLVGELLEEADLSYAWTYTWVFSTQHFLERAFRARRRGKKVGNPVALPGFAGVGVVAHDPDRARRIAEVVEREFDVDQEASILYSETAAQRSALIDPDTTRREQRYRFAEYFVSIPAARTALTEWKPYEGLGVNVDVQTLLQYTGDRVDHDLPYVWDDSYPGEVRERLADYVSLLAAADEQYDRVLSAIQDTRARYEEEFARGELDVELNAESLGAYLRVSPAASALNDLAVGAGLQSDEDYTPMGTQLEQGAFWLLRQNGIATVRQLDEFLRNAAARAPDVFRDIARLSGEAGYLPWSTADSNVEWLVLVLRRADPETISLMRYYDEIEDALNTLIGNPVSRPEAP
jgi:ppGpp synthetase/RelA/SpoT-type nucleotidyltranferase